MSLVTVEQSELFYDAEGMAGSDSKVWSYRHVKKLGDTATLLTCAVLLLLLFSFSLEKVGIFSMIFDFKPQLFKYTGVFEDGTPLMILLIIFVPIVLYFAFKEIKQDEEARLTACAEYPDDDVYKSVLREFRRAIDTVNKERAKTYRSAVYVNEVYVNESSDGSSGEEYTDAIGEWADHQEPQEPAELNVVD